MTCEKIEAAIPHRPPMRLIDEINQWNDDSIECRKTFRGDEFFVQGHFPSVPIVPGVIQCECCLQAGAVFLSRYVELSNRSIPVATRLENARFKQMVRPGDTVDVSAQLNDHLSGAYFMTGKVMLNGKVATRVEFACTLANLESAAP